MKMMIKNIKMIENGSQKKIILNKYFFFFSKKKKKKRKRLLFSDGKERENKEFFLVFDGDLCKFSKRSRAQSNLSAHLLWSVVLVQVVNDCWNLTGNESFAIEAESAWKQAAQLVNSLFDLLLSCVLSEVRLDGRDDSSAITAIRCILNVAKGRKFWLSHLADSQNLANLSGRCVIL